MAVKCAKCGKENRDNAKFCSACGGKLAEIVEAVACPACGEQAEPADKYCGKCGAAISPDAPAEARVEKYDGPWRLTDVVREWIKQQEWEDKPELDGAKGISSTKLHVNGNRIFLDVDEQQEVLRVFQYMDKLKIPAKRLGEANEFVLALNRGSLLGRIQLLIKDDEDAIIRYFHSIDVEDASFEPQHIHNIVVAAEARVEWCLPRLTAICEGKAANDVLSED